MSTCMRLQGLMSQMLLHVRVYSRSGKGRGRRGRVNKRARSEGADLRAYMQTRREASDGRQVYVALHHPM
jgi:hypothetical protein